MMKPLIFNNKNRIYNHYNLQIGNSKSPTNGGFKWKNPLHPRDFPVPAWCWSRDAPIGMWSDQLAVKCSDTYRLRILTRGAVGIVNGYTKPHIVGGAISKLMDAYGDSTHVSLQAFDSCPYCILKKIRRWTTQTKAFFSGLWFQKRQEQQHIKRTPAHSGCFMLCSSLGRWGPHLFGQQTSGYGNHDCFKQLGLPMIAIILVLKCAPHKIRFVPHGLGRRHVANSLESFPGPREGSVGSIWTK